MDLSNHPFHVGTDKLINMNMMEKGNKGVIMEGKHFDISITASMLKASLLTYFHLKKNETLQLLIYLS